MATVTGYQLRELIRALTNDMAQREHNAPTDLYGCVKCQLRTTIDEAEKLAAALLLADYVNG